MKGVCSVDGCGRDHHAHGLCSPHYRRQKAGKPLTLTDRRPADCTPCWICEDAADLAEWGEVRERAAARLGISTRHLERTLRGHGNAGTWNAMPSAAAALVPTPDRKSNEHAHDW
jgi:hypothetical protein